MAFEINRWRTGVKEWWGKRTRNWKEEAQRLGVNSAYGVLVAGAFLPLLTQLGPEATLAALTGIASGVGTNLLSNIVQTTRDKAAKEAKNPPDEEINKRIVQELVNQANNSEIREVLNQVITVSQAQIHASTHFGADWEEFKRQVAADIKQLSSQNITASDSMVIVGDNNIVNPSLSELKDFMIAMKEIFGGDSSSTYHPVSTLDSVILENPSQGQSNNTNPTQLRVTRSQNSHDIDVPIGYIPILASNNTSLKQYQRERDGQPVVLIPPHGRILKAFLIDKHQITNEQYCRFLNVLMSENLIRVQRINGVNVAIDAHEGQELVRDASDVWQNTRKHPWQYPPGPWGIQYLRGSWVPMPKSEKLPATLVTWAGAVVYSLWANGQALSKAGHQIVYLPTRQQWLAAALFDPDATQYRRFPWGDRWVRENVNYAGWWANDEIETYKIDWNVKWASQATIFEQTRPFDVDTLELGCSPSGCHHLLGNVWEWCAEASTERGFTKSPVKGGACNSPREFCLPDFSYMYSQNYVSEYVGFRCCITIS